MHTRLLWDNRQQIKDNQFSFRTENQLGDIHVVHLLTCVFYYLSCSFMCVGVYFCITCMPGASRGQKMVSYTPELEVWMVVSNPVGTRDQICPKRAVSALNYQAISPGLCSHILIWLYFFLASLAKCILFSWRLTYADDLLFSTTRTMLYYYLK